MRYTLDKHLVAIVLAVVSLTAGAVYAGGSSSSTDVVATYKAAHAKASVDELMALVVFQSPSSPLRASWRDDFTNEVKSRISSAKVVPFSEYAQTPPGRLAKGLPPSIRPMNWLVIDFAAAGTSGGSIQRTSLYLICQENGVFFIVGP